VLEVEIREGQEGIRMMIRAGRRAARRGTAALSLLMPPGALTEAPPRAATSGATVLLAMAAVGLTSTMTAATAGSLASATASPAGGLRETAALSWAASSAAAGDGQPRARTTGSVSVNDTGHLRLVKSFGSVLIEQGSVSGTLPGYAKVRMNVGQVVTATFSIATRRGSIYGSGRATLHSSGRYASFGGTLSVSHGSGRYARAHGHGNLYGVIDRRTDALTVQTLGRLGY
jgi:hypothetical protein